MLSLKFVLSAVLFVNGCSFVDKEVAEVITDTVEVTVCGCCGVCMCTAESPSGDIGRMELRVSECVLGDDDLFESYLSEAIESRVFTSLINRRDELFSLFVFETNGDAS